ncbi:GPI inositol deacylase [Coniothyrium glycines]
MSSAKGGPVVPLLHKDISPHPRAAREEINWPQRWRNPWVCSLPMLLTTVAGLALLGLMANSFLTKQLDVKGCDMSYMRPMYSKYDDFDTEHTRFATKYSLYLYNEGGMDNDNFRVKGVPVLFVPGNAGSYKQVRSLASESAYLYHNSVRQDGRLGKLPLDFFSADFNEDFTAFHGQTLLDQAEYLNDAITYILSLYHTPGQSVRDSSLPDPTSIIIVGHSMGGVVARTMLTMPNYQNNSINTIITLAAPHARAPASFDGDIVRTYKGVNEYWRNAYLQQTPANNPLDQVTLVSIAGGGLDTIVSSDYASIESIIPETHGFTVFTSSMPNVWTGMDHLAITWCDQNRKSIVRALYDAIDVTRASQTVPRIDRMRHFKKKFLTGLEDIVEKTLPHLEAQTLLTLKESDSVLARGEKLVLRSLGGSPNRPVAYLLPIPPADTNSKKLMLLTNQGVDFPGEHASLEVLLCSKYSHHPGHATFSFFLTMHLSGDASDATQLICKSAAPDVITLPTSTRQSTFPFNREQPPFAFLQYSQDEFAGHQYVAIVDKAQDQTTGWLVAEFRAVAESKVKIDKGILRLLTNGVSLKLPGNRSLATDISIPALQSSLLAYRLHITRSCDRDELFAPLVRQYVSDVYESKFFVNVEDAEINLHGVSPYLPPSLHSKQPRNGLSLQIWSDATCGKSVEVTLNVDILGSLGKLWMRYRIVFAAFPLLVVTTVLREQIRCYDMTGVFMSFAQGLTVSLSFALPFTMLSLTLLSFYFASLRSLASQESTNNTTSFYDAAQNEALLGSGDPFFWFLVPIFGLMCIALCVVLNYIALALEFTFAILYSLVRSTGLRKEEAQRTPSEFAVTSTRKRLLTTCIVLAMVSTAIPYQFAYVVLCLVQLATTVRAFRLARASRLDTNYNFYNYSHSIFILMLWVLPINIPVLVVWLRNLMIHWLTPFSSHHNILSILPFLLLVETLSTGRMLPQNDQTYSFCTMFLLFNIAWYAAMYGVTYAYVLHHLANVLCAWLVVVHFGPVVMSKKKVSVATKATKTEESQK